MAQNLLTPTWQVYLDLCDIRIHCDITIQVFSAELSFQGHIVGIK